MRGVRCVLGVGGVLCRKGRWAVGSASVIRCKHAHRSSWSTTHCPCPCHKNATTNTPGTKSHSQGAGRGAARLLGAGDTVPERTVRPAATTGGVPAKYSFQLALPYALTMRSHTKLPTFEISELHTEIGNWCWQGA